MANLKTSNDTLNESLTLVKKSQTATLSTADTYVDKDIALTITAQNGAGTLSGAQLTHGNITGNAAMNTYLQDSSTNGFGPIEFSNVASRAAVNYTSTTGGWIDSSNASTAVPQMPASGDDTKTLTKYVKKGTASVDASQNISVTGQITNNNGVLTANLSGSKNITASVGTPGWITSISSANTSASGTATANATDLDSNLKAANIIKGATIFGVAGTGEGAGEATFANTATAGVSYTDISATAPVLIQNSFLFINEGYTSNKKISLAKLVPDEATISVVDGAQYIRQNHSAYDNDGRLVAGSMGDASIKSGSPSVASSSVGPLNTTTQKYPLTASINVSAPTVTVNGYTDATTGTKSTNSGNVTINLDKAGCTVEGGGLTAGAGSSSISVNGYYDGSTISTTDKIALSNTAASGTYKIQTTGKGTVNRAAVTDTHTAGWLEAKAKSTVINAASLDSNSGTTDYYIKKSSGTSQSVNPSMSSQTVTIGQGYYPTDRTITINAIDPSVFTQGVISASDSAISSVTASAGTPVVDPTNFKYNIPLTLSASGTAHAKVTTAGYVTNAKNTSKSLTGSGSATVSLDLYDGTFTWA